MTYALAVLAAAAGGMLVVYGGYDDSPGGQLIGATLVIAALTLALRTLHRTAR